jgi:phosphate transport system permease protein
MGEVQTRLPEDEIFRKQLAARNTRAARWQGFFLAAIVAGMVLLIVLLISVIDEAVGLVALKENIPVSEIADRPIEDLAAPDLAIILQNHLSKGRMQAIFIQEVLDPDIDRSRLASDPVRVFLPENSRNPVLGERTFVDLTLDELGALLAANVSVDRLRQLVYADVVGLEILQSWPLLTSLFNRASIDQEIADKQQGIGLPTSFSEQQIEDIKAKYSVARVEWRSWLNREFLNGSMSATPVDAGIRGAISGTLWVIVITLTVAVPLGVGAAIYLEEYANPNAPVNRIIETNIRNLAGVPSIIYGLLGLAIFARVLEYFTSGKIFGIEGTNGRTVLTAGLTLALLILPVIIINAQEAIRAVPSSIREASYGLGATKWQTIWRQVLPASLPGILTGIILSMSRAVGETAPLVVVGAAVFLAKDPSGPFTAFTTLPIQIYNWAAMPQDQFRDAAAAGIIVLLVILLALNMTAIIIRQRFSRRLQG